MNFTCFIDFKFNQFISNFFSNRRSVLEIFRSSGIDDIGQIKPSLAFCLACIFLMVYFSLWKGVKSTGKVSNFRTTSNHLKVSHLKITVGLYSIIN